MADETVARHLELAAFHLYHALHPDGPAWESDAAGKDRTDCRYLITLAQRRGQPDCVLTAIELVASRLALNEPPVSDVVIMASRRQRHRHMARLVHATLMNYYELGTDDAAYRQHVISEAAILEASDKCVVGEYRKQIGVRK